MEKKNAETIFLQLAELQHLRLNSCLVLVYVGKTQMQLVLSKYDITLAASQSDNRITAVRLLVCSDLVTGN